MAETHTRTPLSPFAARTLAAMMQLEEGDGFEEHLTFWVGIGYIQENGRIITIESKNGRSEDCGTDRWVPRAYRSVGAFRGRMAYNKHDPSSGFWVNYHGRDPASNIRHVLDELHKESEFKDKPQEAWFDFLIEQSDQKEADKALSPRERMQQQLAEASQIYLFRTLPASVLANVNVSDIAKGLAKDLVPVAMRTHRGIPKGEGL